MTVPVASRLMIENGVLQGVRQIACPNYNHRPPNTVIDLVVIHNISLPPDQFGGGYIEQFFLNQLDASIHPYFETIAQLQVSAHLLILRDGTLLQLVNFNERAWHAGRSSHWGRPECNDYSIGIELEGSDFQPFTEAQYHALAGAILAIERAYPKTYQNLTGHQDIAPLRKTDPGPYFNWQYLRQSIAAMRSKY